MIGDQHSWVQAFFRVIDFLYPHMAEGIRESCGVSFIRAPVLFMRAQPWWPNHLQRPPPPNITLGIRIPTCKFLAHRAKVQNPITLLLKRDSNIRTLSLKVKEWKKVIWSQHKTDVALLILDRAGTSRHKPFLEIKGVVTLKTKYSGKKNTEKIEQF